MTAQHQAFSSVPPSPDVSLRPVAHWLFVCAGMILLMAVIGAVTRLTESGLSIVDWKPIHGVIPPLSETAWQEEFERYRQYPEYQKINRGMSLAAFKQIFWWEYIHRLWGRLIGIVFAVPFLWFVVRGVVRGRLVLYLAGLFVLGGMQGVIGWWMVQSGLVDQPDVSHYRLAVHLMMAAVLFALCLGLGLNLRGGVVRCGTPGTSLFARAVLLLVALTMTWGAFVAGLNAGLVYNTFPLMDGGMGPPDLLLRDPWWRSFVEQHGSVQWLHRMLAMLTLAMTWLYWRRARRIVALRRLSGMLMLMVMVQMALGIMTLLWMVPISLGALHQANGFIVLALAVINVRLATIPPSVVPVPQEGSFAGGGARGRNMSASAQTDVAAG